MGCSQACLQSDYHPHSESQVLFESEARRQAHQQDYAEAVDPAALPARALHQIHRNTMS
jgi:hypothetical protein